MHKISNAHLLHNIIVHNIVLHWMPKYSKHLSHITIHHQCCSNGMYDKPVHRYTIDTPTETLQEHRPQLPQATIVGISGRE